MSKNQLCINYKKRALYVLVNEKMNIQLTLTNVFLPFCLAFCNSIWCQLSPPLFSTLAGA